MATDMPPWSVNLTAFDSRLRRIWRMRASSPINVRSTDGSTVSASSRPLSWARGDSSSTILGITSGHEESNMPHARRIAVASGCGLVSNSVCAAMSWPGVHMPH